MAPPQPLKPAAFEACFSLHHALSLHTPSLCCASSSSPHLFSSIWLPPLCFTCFILTVVAVLAKTRHCLGLIRRWSKTEETDLNYPFHFDSRTPRSSQLQLWAFHLHMHTNLFLQAVLWYFFMIKPERQPTLCFLYSLADREIILVNYDLCQSQPIATAHLPFSSFMYPSILNSLIPSVLFPVSFSVCHCHRARLWCAPQAQSRSSSWHKDVAVAGCTLKSN